MPKTFHFTVNIAMDDTTFTQVRDLLREAPTRTLPPVVSPQPVVSPPRQAAPPRLSVADQPLLITSREAAKLLRISERTLWGIEKAEKAPRPVRIGVSVRWNYEELREWAAAGAPDRKEWERLQR